MRRNVQLPRSPMPARTEPMKRGKPLTGNPRISGALEGGFPARSGSRPAASKRPVRETGFPPAARLLIRTRAGNGDASQARCEATGVWLGEHGGEIQHIQARGMGGSRRRNNVANGVLLAPEVHRLAEARDPHLHAQGFWRYSHEPPGPIMLHGQAGGVTVWLTDDGGYSLTPPGATP